MDSQTHGWRMGRALIAHQWVGQAGWGAGLQAHPSEVLPASVTTNRFDVPQCIKQGGTPGVCWCKDLLHWR